MKTRLIVFQSGGTMPFKGLSFRALVSLAFVLISFVTIFSMAGAIAVSAYPTRSVGLSPSTEAGNRVVLVKDKKTKEFNCKKAKCDPGEVKLDKPNIYGACCQTGTAPLTPKTKPAEPEKCKFPGEVGTPPNCSCPPGTEFYGYKGCVEPYCCTSYGDSSDGGGSIKACGEHADVQEKVTSHLFNGHPPARFECYPKE